MLSVQRVRQILASSRMQLVLWITITAFLLDVVTNFIVAEIEQRLLRQNYDQFLLTSMDEVAEIYANAEPGNPEKLDKDLKKSLSAYENRSLFAQIFDDKRRQVWASGNSPVLPIPSFQSDANNPFDEGHHRMLERSAVKPNGESYFVRCGFLQIEVQEDIAVLNRSLGIASLGTLMVVPLGAYFIALRAARPINQIIATTGHLQPSNLDERLPIRGTDDELDRLSQTINGMLDRLASYINQNRDFVANAAHEFRSPLAAIRTSVEVALNRSRSPEEYTAILADVMEEIGRLAGLVNRLLLLAEGDAGRIAGKDQFTRLDKIVRESLEMFEAVAESRSARLVPGAVAAAVVPGDETYLRQVVRNLIDNAIKYNRNPGEVFVDLRIDSTRQQAQLTVRDTGIGIDRDVLPRIFERFYRADKARSREKERGGFGLGLSICQTIVEALHGSITVQSESGQGTTFVVTLPLALDREPAMRSERNEAAPTDR